jgi:hypothetical protein
MSTSANNREMLISQPMSSHFPKLSSTMFSLCREPAGNYAMASSSR